MDPFENRLLMIELQDGQHEGWRNTRRLTALSVLLEAAGEPRVASQVMAAAELHHSELVGQVIADLLAALDEPAQTAITWLAYIGEPEQIAQLAALLDHASAGSRPAPGGGGVGKREAVGEVRMSWKDGGVWAD